MDTVLLLLSIFSFITSIVAIGYCLYLQSSLKKIHQDMHANITDISHTHNSTRKQVEEILTGNLGVIKKLNSLSEEFMTLSDKQNELSLKDPENKLYSRAKKMIELGADINEVIRECEIPLAEAELLFRVQNKSTGTVSPIQNDIQPEYKTETNSTKVVSDYEDTHSSIPKEAQGMMQFFK